MARAPRRSDDEVELRPPTAGDVDAIYAAVCESLPELVAWMTWCHPGYARDETVDWVRRTEQAWADGTEHAFVIVDRRDGRLLGSCGLNALERPTGWANLGYVVRTSATGGGAATRAATLVADFGFAELGLDRVEILAATGNARSQRVAARVGAAREGVLRRRLHVNDVSHDAVVFSLIRDEWPGAHDR